MSHAVKAHAVWSNTNQFAIVNQDTNPSTERDAQTSMSAPNQVLVIQLLFVETNLGLTCAPAQKDTLEIHSKRDANLKVNVCPILTVHQLQRVKKVSNLRYENASIWL